MRPDEWDELAREYRLELLALERERDEVKQAYLAQWPEGDWGRNLAVLLMALD